MTLAESINISVDIRCPFDRANDFLSRPENFPAWASGLGTSLARRGETWIAQTPEGPVHVSFTPPNAFGVIDHTVTLSSGQAIRIPLRVIPNNDGCHVVLTLFRPPGMNDDRFTADADWVRRDLAKLKSVLESPA